MNLAFQKQPKALGNWDHKPIDSILKQLTNGDIYTRIGDHASDKGTDTAYIQIDLGQEYEVYEIKIHSGYGGGYKSAASNTGTIKLKTGLTDTEGDATERDSQTTTSTSNIPITLHYEGEGIRVRYVFISMKGDGTRTQYIKPSEVEVFGC